MRRNVCMTTLLALLLVFALPVFTGAGQTIRIGYEQNHPIASSANDGTAQGIMVDIVQEVARREGWTIQFVPRIWHECLDNLEAGRIDLLVGSAYTPERAEKYSFNKHEYMEQRGILKFMQQMHEAGDRMSRIITNMLKFSRKSESRIESVSMELVLEQALELAASDYDLKKQYDFKRIEIVRDYAPDLPDVQLTILEIEQVLLNLMKNAAQAMAFSQEKKKHRLILHTRQSGDWAVMEIEDNGPGMNQEVQRRIFDPFFTTKEVGIGTGLGLSVSYAIVTNNHHGRLEVRSQSGEGTCFTIMLPMHYQPVTRIPGETT